MPIPTPTFVRVSGTPGTPQFAEWVLRSIITESDGTTQRLLNILHFFRSGGPGTSSETDLWNAITGIFAGGNWSALFNGDVNNVDQTVRFMDDPTRLPATFMGWGVGIIAGSRAASFVSVVAQKIGYGRGRYWRGSNHWGPPAETNYDRDQLNGVGTPNFTLNLVDKLNLLRLPFAAGPDTWQMMILSTTQSDLTANPSIFSGSLISLAKLNVKLGTMKRRKENVGV